MYLPDYDAFDLLSLRPHGRSGLKYDSFNIRNAIGLSPPTRAEWIEIIGLL